MKTIVTKAEFAARKQRGPSSVSNWIADGKITEAALIGIGPRARIWVEQADIDLARAFDPAQQLAQRHPILPPAAQPALAADETGTGVPRSTPAAQAAAEVDADIARKRRADAQRAEADAIAAERRNAIEEGRYIDAAAATRSWSTELARLVTDTDTFVTMTLARILAERHGLEWKQLSAEMRSELRRHRGEIADEAGRGRMAIERELATAAE